MLQGSYNYDIRMGYKSFNKSTARTFIQTNPSLAEQFSGISLTGVVTYPAQIM